MRNHACLVPSFAIACLELAVAAPVEGTELRSPHFVLHHDPDTGAVALTRPGRATPCLRFAVSATATVSIAGNTLNLVLPDGNGLHFSLPPSESFVLIHATLANCTDARTNTRKYSFPEATLDLGVPVDRVRALGTAGLTPVDAHPGSYVFLALADPATRAGLVAGWTTFERGDGLVFSGRKNEGIMVKAETDYGRLLIEPDHSVAGETLALGFFDDVRLGLEQWAALTARTCNVHLPRQLSGYCTWYSQPHGGASDENHIRELTAFAARELKPWGFDYIQVDDHWQDGKRRHGPAKVFVRANPKGPYPAGMRAVAKGVRADGLVPGIWYMPFSGDQDDAWYADKQNWFARRKEGAVYCTSWGGGSLDLTHPEVLKYVGDLAHLIGQNWEYGLFKLDGLWTGLAAAQLYVNNGYRPDDLGQARVHDPTLTPFQAYHEAFRRLRKGAGKNVFILGCNISQNMHSFGAAIGMVDAMRIGPDNGPGWQALQRGPWHGSNRWFLHRRIWYNDPDPVYVRPGVPIEHARLITSWVAVSGAWNACSEWLPGLPPDRIDLIRRSLPAHRFPARPVDVLERDLAEIWIATDEGAGRYVVGLFNWDEHSPAHIEYDLVRLGLPKGKEWVGHEFWTGILLAPFRNKLVANIPPGSCQVLALCEATSRPRVLASSRHITQGLTDLTDEAWDAQDRTLRACTDLVARDPTRITIVATDENGVWAPGRPSLSETDGKAGVRATVLRTGPIITLILTSPDSRTVRWALPFSKSVSAGRISRASNFRVASLTFGRAELAWGPAGDAVWEFQRDHGPVILLDHAGFVDTALSPETTCTYRVRPFGTTQDGAVVKVTTPGSPTPGPIPRTPDVFLSHLDPIRLTTGWGRPRTDRAVGGKPIAIGGETFARGLGVHARSVAVYRLASSYRRFVAVAGLDDEIAWEHAGSVVFIVRVTHADGTTVESARSPVLRDGALRRWHFDVGIPTGAHTIELIVEDAGDGIRCDHADWANAGFVTDR